MQKTRQHRGVVVTAEKQQGHDIQGDGDRPDHHLRDQHAHTKEQAQRKVQQEAGIRDGRVQHDKTSGQQSRHATGQHAILHAEIAKVGDQHSTQQQELVEQLFTGQQSFIMGKISHRVLGAQC